ncbi:MAG: hypothetical protein M3321_02615 [Actinomycetota bacterium]|nr:hypothetical protein [Actinomycetota bacterium]
MPLFGRREPLHEKLARAGGLLTGALPPDDFLARMSGAGIHGLHRLREWDAVATVDAPPLRGERAVFVTLPDGTLLVEEGDDDLASLAEAVEAHLEPPYRAEAVRRHETVWAVAARRIEVVRLDQDPGGDEVTITLRDGEREVFVDGARTFGGVRDLERVAEERFDAYALRAARLEADLWEVDVSPL